MSLLSTQLPAFHEHNSSIWRRMIVIPFDQDYHNPNTWSTHDIDESVEMKSETELVSDSNYKLNTPRV